MNGQSNITQTIVSIPAATSSPVIAANRSRRFLGIQNIGTDRANLGFAGSATVDSGWALASGGAAGDQGGALTLSSTEAVHTGAIYAYSTAGTTLVVLEA